MNFPKKIPGKNICVICGRHHSPEDKFRFPEDFPDEFKMCCFCRGDADLLTRLSLEEVIEIITKRSLNYPNNAKISIDYYKKINKLIAVN